MVMIFTSLVVLQIIKYSDVFGGYDEHLDHGQLYLYNAIQSI